MVLIDIIPIQAGLIEYWLEELLVAASNEGKKGDKNVQQVYTTFFLFVLIANRKRKILRSA